MNATPSERISLAADSSLELHEIPGASATVMVLPGGGYGMLAEHEAGPVVSWLHTLGYSGAVLRYRLAPHHRYPAMLDDAKAAMKILRGRNQHAIGCLGFSAGGHLAGLLATLPSPQPGATEPNLTPDALVLAYPVVSLVGAEGHAGSAEALFGQQGTEERRQALSLQTRISPQCPPTFIWHTRDDRTVAFENSLLLEAACRKHGVTCELHLFETGTHGLGLAPDAEREGVACWPKLAEAFLRRHLVACDKS